MRGGPFGWLAIVWPPGAFVSQARNTRAGRIRPGRVSSAPGAAGPPVAFAGGLVQGVNLRVAQVTFAPAVSAALAARDMARSRPGWGPL